MTWWLVKVVGAGAILASATGFGVAFARDYRQRPLDLRDMMTALRMLRADIAYQSLPLPEAFARIADHFPDKSGVHKVFKLAAEAQFHAGTTAPEALRGALGQATSVLALRDEDLRALAQFSYTLGTTGPALQSSAINAVLIELADREKEAVADRDRFAKVYRTVGILTGILIVVMLW